MNARPTPSGYSNGTLNASASSALRHSLPPLGVDFQPRASKNELQNPDSGSKMLVEEHAATRMEVAKLLLSFQSHERIHQESQRNVAKSRRPVLQNNTRTSQYHSNTHSRSFSAPCQATTLSHHSVLPLPPFVPQIRPAPVNQGALSAACTVRGGVPLTTAPPPPPPPAATTSKLLNSDKFTPNYPTVSGPSASTSTGILDATSVDARPNPLLRSRGRPRVNPLLDLRLPVALVEVSRPNQPSSSSLQAPLADPLADAATSAEDATSTWRRPPGQCRFMGCTKKSVSRERCVAHGGGRRCSVEGCTRGSQRGGKCRAHGGGDRCSAEGCDRSAQISGLCKSHGGRKCCSYQNCTRSVHRLGMCKAHSSQQGQ